MKNEVIKILQRRKKNILENWVKFQLADEGLRDDLMSNEELRSQSEELLNSFVTNLTDASIDDPAHHAECNLKLQRAICTLFGSVTCSMTYEY